MSTLAKTSKNGSLAKTTPKTSFPSVSNWIDDLFFNEFPSLRSSNFNHGMSLPKVNIKEMADKYEVEMAVPGMKKEDFKVDLDNHVLSISTEKEEKREEENENYTRREFEYSSFKRTFTLPETVDESKIKAAYKDGILAIELPKIEEAKQKPARTIKIS
jgi:HSP20 family protein